MIRKSITLSGIGLLILILGHMSTYAMEPSPEIIWIEAECFEDYGGWVNDSQFVDVMGSPYLLAHSVGEPVEDAVTHVDIPTDISYHLWIRCRDWLPEDSPGKFQVLINGTPSPVLFGQSDNDEWKWIDGGRFELKQGEAEIRLHDLTGWWGRCDAIVLSSDEEFKPFNDLYSLEIQRIRYFDPYRQVGEAKSSDVVVVGGGLAGCAAAVSAARHGCSVVLIQDRSMLGGNASNEIKVPPAGDIPNHPLDPLETGIIEEFYNIPGRGRDHDWSAALEKVVRGEPNIDLHLNTRAINVVMKDHDTIQAVLALDVQTGERRLFPARLFIDCTGDGWIGFWAGATFRKGREARSEFNESLAPEQPDSKTMGNALQVARFEDDASEPFDSPSWAYNRWKYEDDFQDVIARRSHIVPLEYILFPVRVDESGLTARFTHGSGFHGRQFAFQSSKMEIDKPLLQKMPVPFDQYRQYDKGKGYSVTDRNGGFFKWYVELGGMSDTIYNAEKIRDELLRINLGLWNYVKNYHSKFKEQNINRRLTWVTYVPGKRESRRLIGDYILTQWDYTEGVIHEDNVAYSGWGIDLHHPNGFWTDGPMSVHTMRGDRISIPYRCLYSKNISNLLMAGRNISVSHVALGGVRVMRTTTLMGQAAGTAAALGIENNVDPSGVSHYVHELQQRLLKDGCYIMGQQNEDPDDLALKASVTASSVKTYGEKDIPLYPENVIDGVNRVVGDDPHSWGPNPKLALPQWIELSFDEPVEFNTVHVSFQNYAYSCPNYKIQVADGNTMKTVADVKENDTRRNVLHFDKVKSLKLRLVLEAPALKKPNDSAQVCEIRVYNEGE